MAITGHPKFFYKSGCLEKDGATISASSGDASAAYAIDQNPETVWRSVGSTDLTTEEIILTFEEQEISRLALLGTNLKDFNVMYDLLGVWTHFASVIGLDGSKSNVTETAFVDSAAYYEFTPVTTTSIRIRALKTQTANLEKYISQIIVTREIGTLLGFPMVRSVELNRNSRVKKTLSGFFSVQKSIEVPTFDMDFRNYPARSTYSPDFDLIMTLQDLEDPFLVWLCGGKRGTAFFKYTLRGYRLQDMYQMAVSKPLKLNYTDNIYSNTLNAKVEFDSVI